MNGKAKGLCAFPARAAFPLTVWGVGKEVKRKRLFPGPKGPALMKLFIDTADIQQIRSAA